MGNAKMKNQPRRHAQAGNHVVIQAGPLKDTAVKIVDYLTAQFQGKSIQSLSQRADLGPEINVLKRRGFELTDQTVFAIVPETPPRYILLDDSEIQKKDKPKLTIAKEPEDDTRTTSEGDSGATESSGSDEPGCGVLGSTTPTKVEGEALSEGQADSPSGSTIAGEPDPAPVDDKPKAGSGSSSKPKRGK